MWQESHEGNSKEAVAFVQVRHLRLVDRAGDGGLGLKLNIELKWFGAGFNNIDR